jgi:hypothetical protein
MKVRTFIMGVVAFSLLSCASNSNQRATLRLSFVVDKRYDAEYLIGIFRSDDPAGLESRARSMGIDPGVARRIHDAPDKSDTKALAAKLVQDRFDKDGESIQASTADFEAEWKDLLALFSDVVIKTTESAWVHPEYICVASSVHPGLSSWYGNKVAVKYDETSAYKRRILAHEIVLSDVFQLLRRHHSAREVSDWQVWAYAEITAVLILDDSSLYAFWPNFPRAGEWFSKSNYPQLAELEAKLKALFDHRTHFADYETGAVGILKNFK